MGHARNRKLCTALLVLSSACLVLSGCMSTAQAPQSPLVGKWVATTNASGTPWSETLTFHQDGTVTASNSNGNVLNLSYKLGTSHNVATITFPKVGTARGGNLQDALMTDLSAHPSYYKLRGSTLTLAPSVDQLAHPLPIEVFKKQ